MFEKHRLLQAAIILIASLAVLQFLSPAIMNIDTSTLADWEVGIINLVQHFFVVTPIALLAGFGWSLFGFLRYKFGDAEIQYEIDKVYQTWTWTEGMLAILAVGLPLQYSTAVTGIILAVKSVFNSLKSPTSISTVSGLNPPITTD